MNITLLDLAARTDSDPVVGLIEQVLTSAPEMQTLPIRTITGTSYKATLRTALPGSGIGVFRDVNEGVETGSSTYTQKTIETYFMDKQLEVDEAIVKGQPYNIGDILMDELEGALRDCFIQLSNQFYRGTDVSSKGFSGLPTFLNTDLEVDAAGTGPETYS